MDEVCIGLLIAGNVGKLGYPRRVVSPALMRTGLVIVRFVDVVRFVGRAVSTDK